jgi:hypothetical protein
MRRSVVAVSCSRRAFARCWFGAVGATERTAGWTLTTFGIGSGFAGEVIVAIAGSGVAGTILVSIVGLAGVASGFADSAVDGVAALLVEPPKLMSARTALTVAAPRMRCKRLRDRGGAEDGENGVGRSSHCGMRSTGVAASSLPRVGVIDHHLSTDGCGVATAGSGVVSCCAADT